MIQGRIETMRATISAKFLLCPVPGKRDAVDFTTVATVTRCPTKRARGIAPKRWSGEAGPMSSHQHGMMYHGAKQRGANANTANAKG
jgi:hypothetical protein